MKSSVIFGHIIRHNLLMFLLISDLKFKGSEILFNLIYAVRNIRMSSNVTLQNIVPMLEKVSIVVIKLDTLYLVGRHDR